MQRDKILLEKAEQGQLGCRVYGWNGPWVSLGRFQSPNRDLVEVENTNWVIRPTGGKAVLHGHDVTIGLAVPLRLIGRERSLRPVYRAVVAPVIEALRGCGVPAILAEDRNTATLQHRTTATADCFAFSSPNDVVDERTGQKLCGCALRITESAVLLQASIPNGEPLVPPETLIRQAKAISNTWNSENFIPSLSLALECFNVATKV